MKISVIIPTYNCENTLKRTINSVINQTIGFENIELLIIDNNSTDTTKNIIKEFSDSYDNVVPIFFKKNHGNPSNSRNIGIESSKCDYIMFLDGDDEYDEEMCEKLYFEAINDKSLDFVGCGFYHENEPLNFGFNKQDFVKFEGNNSDSNWKKIRHQHNQRMCLFSLWNKIFKKSFLNEFNLRLSKYLFEDVNFMITVLTKVSYFGFFNNYIGYIHTFRPDSRMYNFGNFERLDVIEGGAIMLNRLNEEKSDLIQFYFSCYSLSFFSATFLSLDLGYNDLKKVFNKYLPLFKEGIKLSESKFCSLFLRIFTYNFRTAILIYYIFKYLKIRDLIIKLRSL